MINVEIETKTFFGSCIFQGDLDELGKSTKMLEEDLKKLSTFRDEQREKLKEEEMKKVDFYAL